MSDDLTPERLLSLLDDGKLDLNDFLDTEPIDLNIYLDTKPGTTRDN